MSDSKAELTAAVPNPAHEETAIKESGSVKASAVGEKANAESKDGAQNGDGEAKRAEGKNGQNEVRTYDNGMLKTTAREHQDRDKNSKYDPSVLKTSDNPKEIRGQVGSTPRPARSYPVLTVHAQVEFYFSDTNLRTDNHMNDITKGTENVPVPVTAIHSFGRMKRFQPYSAVVAALKESKFLKVTGEEGKEVVSRIEPFDPTVPKSKSELQSVYVKGFGDEEPSSQFDIEAFFSQYGSTNAVRLRRTPEKLFKGSVFVEFSDKETADKFLAMDPQPLWKGKHVLQIMSKKAYLDIKNQEIADGTLQPSESWGPSRGRGHGRGRGRGRGSRNNRDGGRDKGDRDRDPDDWKKRREEDRANGFKDNRGGGHNKGGRGRRDDRGPRKDDRNRERREKKECVQFDPGLMMLSLTNVFSSQNPETKEEVNTELKAEAENEKKRPHDDDGAEEQPAKKVDTKPEVSAEAA